MKLSGKRNKLTFELTRSTEVRMIPVQTDIIDSRCVWAGPNNEYRYVLHRLWDQVKPKIVFIGLNPSVANERIDDNTVRKCITIARRDGFGEMIMLNAYGYRSTDPSALKTHPDPTGDLNDYHISEQCKTASKVVAAWGNHATDERHQLLLNLLGKYELCCFARNKNGKPKHPLYTSNKATLIFYKQP